jgi:hypothetical protein
LVTEIRIYFEGDGALRPGFSHFFEELKTKAGVRRFRLIAGGSGAEVEKDYRIALKQHPDAWNILLRDSEGPVPSESVDENHCWMVQLMESWFLADPKALEDYYGDGFKRAALKKNPLVEQIPKDDVLDCLNRATRDTQKRRYDKTGHAPDILARIDPIKVRSAAPHCELLFQRLLEGLDQGR